MHRLAQILYSLAQVLHSHTQKLHSHTQACTGMHSLITTYAYLSLMEETLPILAIVLPMALFFPSVPLLPIILLSYCSIPHKNTQVYLGAQQQMPLFP